MKHRSRAVRFLLGVMVALLVLAPTVTADPAPGADEQSTLTLPLVTRSLQTISTASRFGVGLAGGHPDIASFPSTLAAFPDITSLGFGWYSNWSAAVTPEQPDGVEFVQLINTRSWPPNWSALDLAIQANPGATWIIGNEPEIASQGKNTPAEYAAIYHEAYTHIKAVDPSARVAIGGVVMPSPLRLAWLDEVLAHYESAHDGAQMPVDVWNIHMQILPEGLRYGCFLPYGLSMPLDQQRALAMNLGGCDDPDDEDCYHFFAYNADAEIFEQLIRDFRAWMAARGQRNKPLIISEYGVLFPSTFIANEFDEDYQQAEGDKKVIAFMQQTFDFMLTATDPAIGYPGDGNRLVQRWLWFSVNVPLDEYNGSLYDYETRQMTPFGHAYRDYVAAAKAGTLSSLPQVRSMTPEGPIERWPLPASGLPDLTKRPPYEAAP